MYFLRKIFSAVIFYIGYAEAKRRFADLYTAILYAEMRKKATK